MSLPLSPSSNVVNVNKNAHRRTVIGEAGYREIIVSIVSACGCLAATKPRTIAHFAEHESHGGVRGVYSCHFCREAASMKAAAATIIQLLR